MILFNMSVLSARVEDVGGARGEASMKFVVKFFPHKKFPICGFVALFRV